MRLSLWICSIIGLTRLTVKETNARGVVPKKRGNAFMD
jgi:hypothetical protein